LAIAAIPFVVVPMAASPSFACAQAEGVPADMAVVPAGEFPMGNPWTARFSEERPVHTVDLDEYWIDVFEVTNAQFAAVLNWAHERHKLRDEDGRLFDGDSDVYFAGRRLFAVNQSDIRYDDRDNRFVVQPRNFRPMLDHPVTFVTWYGAINYCNWRSEMDGLTPCYTEVHSERVHCNFAADGYRLPTEAEWEKAASYDPWTVDPVAGPKQEYAMIGPLAGFARANFYDPDLKEFNNPDGLQGQPFTAPVGFFDGRTRGTIESASPWGCFDMSGNVWEWCWDWYDPEYYTRSPHDNPLGPGDGDGRVVRGGSWIDVPENLRATKRAGWHAERADEFIGFRTARIPTEESDLVGEGFDFFPRVVSPDARIDFTGRIRNTGTHAIDPFWIEIRVSLGPDFGEPHFFLVDSIFVPGILPGQLFDLSSVTRTVTLPDGILPGTFHVGMFVDTLDDVAEPNEINNSFWVRDHALFVFGGGINRGSLTGSRRWELYR
jgi:formylglycine-generating enzyme required for sulfatase activity